MTTTKIDFIDYVRIASATGTSTTTGKSIVGCNGKVYFGGFGSWTQTGTAAYDNTAAEIMTVAASQNWYLVDGTSCKEIAGADGAVTDFVVEGGDFPTGGPRIITLYRNRLVFARTSTDPHNIFMSAVGVYGNFDYAAETSTAAVALNASDAGAVPDVVTALIPFNDDRMVIGSADSVWLLRGDPAAGGRLDNLVWGGGIIGSQAWARDSLGSIYYLSRSDLMMIPPGGGLPQSISGNRLQKFLSDVDWSIYQPRMAWDDVSKGLWIFLSRATQATLTHLHWDQRADAFTLHQFPNNHGPTAVKNLAGLVYQDQQIILGGFDGILRTLDPAWVTDDGQTINSRAKFAPMPIAEPGEYGVINEMGLVVGNTGPLHLTYKTYLGDNAQDAVESATPAVTGEATEAGRLIRRDRSRGQSLIVELSNTARSRTWSFESGYIIAKTSGKER